MDRLLDKTRKVIFAKQTSIFSSTLILATMIIAARFFGFVRNHVMNSFFDPAELDIYLSAFRIPDLIFEIIVTGALSTSFIPFFIKYDKDREAQSENISSIINLILISLIGFVIVMVFLLPFIMPVITPGYSKVKTDQIIFFSQLLLVGQLPFFVVGSLLTGMSQARKAFLIPALAPVIYNIAIIVMTYLFSSSLYLMGPVLGVIVGAALFFLIQIPIFFTSDFTYRFILHKTRAVYEFFGVAFPRIFTVIVSQIDATIDLSLATLLGPGSYTIFYYAQHLQLLPVSVIGIAFGQASLPYLSEVYHKKDMIEFKKIVIDSILNLIYFTFPITAFFIFARTPMVRIFYGGEKYDWNTTVLTAFTLSIFALSVPAHSTYYFLTRCFYAMFDSKTPFMIGLLTIGLNTILSLYFVLILKLPVWALSISFSSTMILNVLILFFILRHRLNGLDIKFMLIETVKIAGATFVAAFFAYNFQKILDLLVFDTSRTINLFFMVCITSICYFLLYLFLSWVFNIKEVYLITKMLLKVKEYQKKLFEIYSSGIS